MSEEMNEQNTRMSASPWLSKTVVIVIAAHVVVIMGVIVFIMLRGDVVGKDAEVAANAGETSAADRQPSAETVTNSGSDNIVSPAQSETALTSTAPVSPQVPAWTATASTQTLTVTRPEPVPATVTPTVSGGTYTVQKGDSLYKISRQFKVSVVELKQSNGLLSDAVKVGQVLKVPAGGVAANPPVALQAGPAPTVRMAVVDTPVNNTPAPEPSASATAPSACQTYKIAPGDTLYKIAKQFNTKPDVIAKVNNISDPSKLKVGTELKVPLTVRETARPVAPVLDNVNVARLPQNRN